MSFSTADLYDEHGDALGSCDTQFRSFGGHRTFSGAAVTVRCAEDNVVLRSVISEQGNGRVVVVDGGGSLHRALMGDLMAQLAVDNGWAGIVVHGAVRDTAVLAGLPLGVKALGSNPRPSTKTGAGERDVPVAFGGATFRTGDRIFCDDDGVVVLPG
jgi:regulator of ribonuclease activity A